MITSGAAVRFSICPFQDRSNCTASPNSGLAGFLAIVGRHNPARQETRERGVNILLHAQHFFRLPTGARQQPVPNLARAIRRAKLAAHAVRIVFRKRILIGRHDPSARRIVEGRQLIERNKAVPLEVAARAIHRHVAVEILADRKHARRPDIRCCRPRRHKRNFARGRDSAPAQR